MPRRLSKKRRDEIAYLAGFGVSGAITQTSFEFRPNLRYTEWAKAGARIAEIDRAAQWWAGDWLVYGETAYGERFAQATDATGYEPGTLLNLAHVARVFEPERRRAALTWSHHHAVASLATAEQERLLDAAGTGDERSGGLPWSVSRLREAVRIARKTGGVGHGDRAKPGVQAPTGGEILPPADLPATEPLLPEIAVGARFRLGSVVYRVAIVDGPWTDGAISLRLERLDGGL